MPLPRAPRTLRAIGFDDAPFARRRGATVHVVGVVCAGTRFEGMLTGRVRKDGFGATEVVATMLERSKFLPQLHLVLLDGIAFGGLNVLDLEALAARVRRPCVSVMRRAPDLAAMEAAIRRLPNAARRLAMLRRAGAIHASPPFHFQVRGAEPDEIAEALPRLTDVGHVPEALRLAHLVGGAMVKGESGRGA